MGWLTGLKHIFGGRTAGRADYDAASDNRHLKATYGIATDRNQNRILEEERGTIRTRLNSEARNNIHMRRVAKLYANFAVGTGPSLQMRSKKNPEWAKKFELGFRRWSLKCDARSKRRRNKLSLARMLHIGTRRLFPDGEFMLVLERGDNLSGKEVSLRLRTVRANRRCTPLEESLNERFVDGIELDDSGEPLQYWFLKKDPGDTTGFQGLGYSKADFDKVAAQNVIHVFLPDEFEQDTGEPLGSPALSTIAGDRRFRNATLLAAETAAKFAVFFGVENPELINPGGEEGGFNMPTAEGIEISAGTASFMPPGYKATQVDPKHPSTTYPEFKRENLAELGLVGDMPVNLVTGDSSKHNFASAQFDGWTVEIEMNCYRRYALEENALDIIVEEYMREAELMGLLPPTPDDVEWSWGWPVNRYWRNPLHQANADEKDMASRKKTLFDVWDENGKDAEDMIEKLQRQDELLESLRFKPSFLSETQTDTTEGTDYATGEEKKETE